MMESVSAQPLPANTQSGAAPQDLEPGLELRAKVDANLPGGVVRLVSDAKSIELRVPAPLPVGSEVTVTVSGTRQQPAVVLTPAQNTGPNTGTPATPNPPPPQSGSQTGAQPQSAPPQSGQSGTPAQTVPQQGQPATPQAGLQRSAPVLTQFLQATGVLPQPGQAGAPGQTPSQSGVPGQGLPSASTPAVPVTGSAPAGAAIPAVAQGQSTPGGPGAPVPGRQLPATAAPAVAGPVNGPANNGLSRAGTVPGGPGSSQAGGVPPSGAGPGSVGGQVSAPPNVNPGAGTPASGTQGSVPLSTGAGVTANGPAAVQPQIAQSAALQGATPTLPGQGTVLSTPPVGGPPATGPALLTAQGSVPGTTAGAANPQAPVAQPSVPASGPAAAAQGPGAQALQLQPGSQTSPVSGAAGGQTPVQAYSAARAFVPSQAAPSGGAGAGSSVQATPLQQAAAALSQPLAEQQASLSGLYAQIATLMTAQSAGKASVPDALQKAMQQIMGLRLNSAQPVTANALQQAVRSSGQFKEAQLPQTSGGLPAGGGDLKATLLSFKSLLQTLGAQPAARFPAKQPAPPSRQTGPQGQAAQTSSGYWAGSAPQNLQSLLQETDAALARMRLTQLVNAGLAGDDGPQAAAAKPMDAVVELPIALGNETTVMQMQVGRDGGGNNGEEEDDPAWRLRFALDLTATGPLEAAVSLRGGGTYVSLWVERKETLDLLTGLQETMEAAFADAGLNLQELRFIRGLPPRTAAKYGALINRQS